VRIATTVCVLALGSLAFAAAGGARTETVQLTGTVGPGFTITLKNRAKTVKLLAPTKYTFRTWDAFELPLPFSRIAIVYGEPIVVGRGITADALPDWQSRLGERLLGLRRAAEAALDRR